MIHTPIIKFLAHRCGFLVIPTSKMSEWLDEADERLKIARDYDTSDKRLSGLNDGRAEILLRVCKDLMYFNQKF